MEGTSRMKAKSQALNWVKEDKQLQKSPFLWFPAWAGKERQYGCGHLAKAAPATGPEQSPSVTLKPKPRPGNTSPAVAQDSLGKAPHILHVAPVAQRVKHQAVSPSTSPLWPVGSKILCVFCPHWCQAPTTHPATRYWSSALKSSLLSAQQL